jgi:hypothetical protein
MNTLPSKKRSHAMAVGYEQDQPAGKRAVPARMECFNCGSKGKHFRDYCDQPYDAAATQQRRDAFYLRHDVGRATETAAAFRQLIVSIIANPPAAASVPALPAPVAQVQPTLDDLINNYFANF